MPSGFLTRKLRRVLDTNQRAQQLAGILCFACTVPFVVFAELPLWTAPVGAGLVGWGWYWFEHAADTDKRKAERDLTTMRMEATDE